MCDECKTYYKYLERRYNPRWWQRLCDWITAGEDKVASAGISG